MENEMEMLAREAGVVGAGGAGFPTHVKLNAQVESVIVNGAECEPLITVDQVLILNYAGELAFILEKVRRSMGAKEAVVAIKSKHSEAVRSMKRAVAGYPEQRVYELGDFYPAGDEAVLVYEVLGKQIPHSGLPLDCGAVVINVETLYNLYHASQGHPLTHKWVTVAGEVERPGTYRVPLGVRMREMIALAEGTGLSEYAVINGGPMMGKLVTDLDEPVTKTTKGILVLPKSGPVARNRTLPLSQVLRRAQSLCCQCQLCTDLCPRNLLGYEIHPNRTILAASYGFEAGKKSILEAWLCSECGACDFYACPMGLSPRRVNQMLKGELGRRKIPNPYRGRPAVANEWRSYRRIPVRHLMSRLELERYESPARLIDDSIQPEKVTLPLKQHVGVPSSAVVAAGDLVETGQCVARIPKEGSLSSNLFASIAGRVVSVTETAIVIHSGSEEGQV
ncbi:4Fe-4S dicluster domain-containing protein [Caproiciproducens sp.]